MIASPEEGKAKCSSSYTAGKGPRWCSRGDYMESIIDRRLASTWALLFVLI